MYDNSYSYDYSTTSSTDAGAAAAIALMIFFFMFIIFIAVYVVTAFFLSKVFKKAGIEPAWAAWVPIFNSWKLLEMGGQQGFWAVLALVPVLNLVALVFQYIAMYHIGLKFGKDGVFFLLAFFLPIVWIIWLAVDKKAVWQGAPAQDATMPPETTTQQ